MHCYKQEHTIKISGELCGCMGQRRKAKQAIKHDVKLCFNTKQYSPNFSRTILSLP